jgi:hypothetical protein
MSKPELAQRISQWMVEAPDRIPDSLQRLVLWMVKSEKNQPNTETS